MALICAFAALVSIVVTWTLASSAQRSAAIKYIFGSSQTEDRPKAPDSNIIPAAGTIAGLWKGTIFYLDGRASKPFTFTFDAVGCRGRGDEPNTFGDQTSTRLHSNLECGTNTLSPAQSIRIKKTYDGTGEATHTVVYRGNVSADMRKISGEWSTGSAHGNFILER
jgi:hypothetical protein